MMRSPFVYAENRKYDLSSCLLSYASRRNEQIINAMKTDLFVCLRNIRTGSNVIGQINSSYNVALEVVILRMSLELIAILEYSRSKSGIR